MKENRTSAIAIKFSEQEAETLAKAKECTVLSENALIRVLVRETLEDLQQKRYLIIRFDLCKEISAEIYETKIVRFKEKDYKKIKKICKSTTFIPSNLIKLWILPKLEQIIKDEKWEGKV